MCAASPAHATPVDELKALLARGQGKEAYERGTRYPDQLGEPLFDYYFGLAAIEAGRPAEGTLALERYVVTYPDDLVARLELGRGYFLMGEDKRATEEFRRVEAANPPAGVASTIRKYLDAIEARERRHRNSLTLFAEAGAGYDTNVNGGVSNANVTLPIGQVIVRDSGLKTDNGFLSAAAAAQLNIPVSPGWSVFGGIAGDTKNHFNQDPYDLRSLTASAGAARTEERSLVRVTGAAGSLWLDNDRFRDVGSLTGEYYRQLQPSLLVNGFAQWAQLGYTGGNEVRDSDIFSVGGGLKRDAGGKWQWSTAATLSIGREQNRRDRDDLSRDLYSARVGLTFVPKDRLTLHGALSAQGSYYVDPDFILSERRRDWFLAFEAGSSYALTDQWSFRVDLVVSRNRSNIDLYDFNRNLATARLRYELR